MRGEDDDGIAQQMRCAVWAGEETRASGEEAAGTGKARPAAMAIRDGDGGRVREGNARRGHVFVAVRVPGPCECEWPSAMRRDERETDRGM